MVKELYRGLWCDLYGFKNQPIFRYFTWHLWISMIITHNKDYNLRKWQQTDTRYLTIVLVTQKLKFLSLYNVFLSLVSYFYHSIYSSLFLSIFINIFFALSFLSYLLLFFLVFSLLPLLLPLFLSLTPHSHTHLNAQLY